MHGGTRGESASSTPPTCPTPTRASTLPTCLPLFTASASQGGAFVYSSHWCMREGGGLWLSYCLPERVCKSVGYLLLPACHHCHRDIHQFCTPRSRLWSPDPTPPIVSTRPYINIPHLSLRGHTHTELPHTHASLPPSPICRHYRHYLHYWDYRHYQHY